MRKCIILALLLFSSPPVFCQQNALNIPGLHQLVGASKSENRLQNEAKKSQVVVSANEYQNKTMLAKLKYKYRQLQQRYNALGTIISAANIGINAAPMVKHIVDNQVGIYQVASENPSFIPLAYSSEVEFVSKARSLINYLIGLTANIGAINQMKISDRKILFDYILSELNTIQSLSSSLLNSMQFSQANGLLRSMNPFQDYLDQDREIIGEIIRNAKYLKQ